jgi:hypothetical protein
MLAAQRSTDHAALRPSGDPTGAPGGGAEAAFWALLILSVGGFVAYEAATGKLGGGPPRARNPEAHALDGEGADHWRAMLHDQVDDWAAGEAPTGSLRAVARDASTRNLPVRLDASRAPGAAHELHRQIDHASAAQVFGYARANAR